MKLRKRNSDVETLRAFAIILTLVHHLPFVWPVSPGWWGSSGKFFTYWAGVDLFFVVSGFVITGSLREILAERAAKKPVMRELVAFWIRRLFRLFPVACLYLSATLIALKVASWYGVGPEIKDMSNAFFAAIFNYSNIYYAHCNVVGNPLANCPSVFIFGHYWSLSLEEQFYLLFPLAILILRGPWLSVAAAIGIAACALWARPMFSHGWYLRVDGFLWGILLAIAVGSDFWRRINPRLLKYFPLRWSVTALLLALLTALPARWFGDVIDISEPHRPYALACVALTCACLVWLASYDRGYIAGSGKARKVLTYIGARSYSIYVVHLPVYFIFKHCINWPAFNAMQAGVNFYAAIMAVVVTFGLSEITSRLVEEPSREFGRRLALAFVTKNKPTVLQSPTS